MQGARTCRGRTTHGAGLTVSLEVPASGRRPRWSPFRRASRAGIRPGARRSRGQSLVEFAITLPLILLLVLFGVDFARVFSGWLTLTNAVREAAAFAAINPRAWTSPGSPNARAEYARLINTEASTINCTMPATLPSPSFPSGFDLGSPAIVAVTCQFSLITPGLSALLSSQVNVSASASFPIRSGSIAGVPTSGTSLPTPAPTATPAPTCTVPNLVQGSLKTDGALTVWVAAGFTSTNLLFDPLVPPHYDIKDQSRTAGSTVACTSGMTVYDKNQ